jgi:hypothetical protein
LERDLGAVVDGYDFDGVRGRVDLSIELGPEFISRRMIALSKRNRETVALRFSRCAEVRSMVELQRSRTRTVGRWVRDTEAIREARSLQFHERRA